MRRCRLTATAVGAAVSASLALGSPDVRAAEPPDLGLTPPMAWNTWSQFHADISEQLVKDEADLMVSTGLKAAGYDTLLVDGGWRAAQRDANGDMQSDPVRFPSGIKALVDYVHSKGLKFGLHQSAGVLDGGRRSPGTQTAPGDTYAEKARHDARTFAAWGIDYLKFDRNNFDFPDGTLPGAPDVDRLAIRSGDATILSREAEANGNVLAGKASVGPCAQCSGGRMVQAIGIGGGSIRFDGLDVPRTGDYTLDLSLVYVNRGQWDDSWRPTESYAAYVAVDGGAPELVRRDASRAVDGTVFTVTLDAHLHAGENTVAISNPRSDEEVLREAFTAMSRALKQTGRPIVYSMSGAPRPWLWGQHVANLGRIGFDMAPWWDKGVPGQSTPASVATAIDLNESLASYAGRRFRYWNDPDFLQVGVHIDDPFGRFPGELTGEEGRSQISMWAIMAAPLIAGPDLRSASAETIATLSNREVIGVDQDPLGIQGVRVRDDGDSEVWVKPLARGDRAVALFNRSEEPRTIRTSADEVGLPAAPDYRVRDLWSHEETSTAGDLAALVPPHGVAMLRVGAGQVG